MEQRVKGVMLTSAQQQLFAMRNSGELQVRADDEPTCLTDKPDPARWYSLEELNSWTEQVQDLVGRSCLVEFGRACAERLGETGIYQQFEVTLEAHGFSLGSKLMLSFAGVSHPYTEWTFAEADEDRGVVIDVAGSKNWNDAQSAITLGWVFFLAGKMIDRPLRHSWERIGSGDVRYRVEVV